MSFNVRILARMLFLSLFFKLKYELIYIMY